MIFLLDGDKEGKDQKGRYLRKYALQDHKIMTLDEIENITEIEDLLDDEAKSMISEELGIAKRPSKKQILSFFQERLASDNVAPLSKEFEIRSKAVLVELRKKLNAANAD